MKENTDDAITIDELANNTISAFCQLVEEAQEDGQMSIEGGAALIELAAAVILRFVLKHERYPDEAMDLVEHRVRANLCKYLESRAAVQRSH